MSKKQKTTSKKTIKSTALLCTCLHSVCQTKLVTGCSFSSRFKVTFFRSHRWLSSVHRKSLKYYYLIGELKLDCNFKLSVCGLGYMSSVSVFELVYCFFNTHTSHCSVRACAPCPRLKHLFCLTKSTQTKLLFSGRNLNTLHAFTGHSPYCVH